MRLKISPFAILLIFTILSFVGVVSIPLLNIQYTPETTGNTISASFSYIGAPAEVVESTVTSKIEGIMAHTSGCISTSSRSSTGYGYVSASFSRHTDIATARMEIASNIRNIFPSFPNEVSYPVLSHNAQGKRTTKTSMSFHIMGNLPTEVLEKYTTEKILPKISAIDGITTINLKGATHNQWVVTFDTHATSSMKISPNEISSAIQNNLSEKLIGVSTKDNNIAVRLISDNNLDFGNIPIKRVGDKVVYLRDIAQWKYQEAVPTSYYRVNGLNTIIMSIKLSGNKNIIHISKEVQSTISKLTDILPPEISISLASDLSEQIIDELNDIFIKILLSLLFILLFIITTRHSWKYTLIILISTLINILICFSIYVLGNISIHIYTLVGTTISMGITMGIYTIAIEHYTNEHHIKINAWINSSVITIIGALITLLILPEEQKKDLKDFVLVVSINLGVATIVSQILIPSLIKYLPIEKRIKKHSLKRRRKIALQYNRYREYLNWGRKHRWAYVVMGIICFGIPTCALPSYEELNDVENKTEFENLLEKVVKWDIYRDNRNILDKYISSSFGIFYRTLNKSNFYRKPHSNTLNIVASMPEGCTISQLNEVIKSMENFLANSELVQSFTTIITPTPQANIEVILSSNSDNKYSASEFKARVISQASKYGGANWSVSGIDDNSFNNNITFSQSKYRILLTGYNYTQLERYARYLNDYISKNKRVINNEIRSTNFGIKAQSELNMSYDFESIVLNSITPHKHYSAIYDQLYNHYVSSVYINQQYSDIVLESSLKKKYDFWNMLNNPTQIDDNQIALKNIGNIEKKPSAIDIIKTDQSYELNVCFDVIGSYELAKRIINKCVSHLNNDILPLGYKATNPDLTWSNMKDKNYIWIIFLIVAVIFVSLNIALESFRYSLSIIFTMLLSYISPFLIIGNTNSDFDQGGFVGFIILSGIIALIGIYIIYTFRANRYSYTKVIQKTFKTLLLALISISISAVPFLLGGQDDVFWFDFATVIISGIILFVPIVLFIFPIFLKEPSTECKQLKTKYTLCID